MIRLDLASKGENLGLKLVFAAAFLFWTSIVALSGWWTYRGEWQNIVEYARAEARMAWQKDVLYRRWSALHGGVYVPVTETTLPNPYLQVPNRDVQTTDGIALTLINPAYMTRQVYEMSDRNYLVKGHITSLNPIRPENAPVPWERQALAGFTGAGDEYSTVSEVDGKFYMHFMRPLITEKGCLKCHGAQGYKEGDIRGGISVSVPLEPFQDRYRNHLLYQLLAHGAIWLTGLLGMGFCFLWLLRGSAERVRAEHAIIAERDRARQYLDTVEAVIVCLDREGRITLINRKGCSLLGYEASELLGKNWFEHCLAQPDGMKSMYPFFRQIISGEIEFLEYFENIVLTRSGARPMLAWHSSILRDPSGAIVGTLSAGEDITEQWRSQSIMQARLRLIERSAESTLEELLRATIDEVEALTESRIGFFHFLDADQHTITLQTWSTQTLQGMCTTAPESRHSDIDRAGVWTDCVRQRRGVMHNDYASLPHRRGMPPGHAAVSREINVPVFRGNLITAILGVGNKPYDYDQGDIEVASLLADLAWDITVHKQAQDSLRASEERYRMVANFTYDWEFWIDPEGKYRYISPSFERITGYTVAELAARPELFEEIVHPEDAPAVRGHLHSTRCSTDSPSEFRIITRSGEVRWLSHVCQQIHGADGTYLGRRGSNRDVTDLKLMQQDATRSARLASIGELAAGVAHEINNPVTGMINCAQVIKDSLGNQAKCTKAADIIIDEGRRVASIVRNLLNLSRQGDEALKPCDLAPVLHDSYALLARQMQKCGIAVTQDVPAGLPPIMAHPQKLQQVFINLLTNAMYALNARYPQPHIDKTLAIDAEAVTHEGRPCVRITFHDRGSGIPQAIIDKICNPFFTTKPVGDGTGLGLSITQSIVKEHGGALLFESIDGEYTKVMVVIPAAIA